MENKNYADVVGSVLMPYFHSLVPKGALATQYYANVHPSIGNYFIMTTGIPVSVDDAFAGVVTTDNVARDLVSAGKSWKVYAESLPSVGYIGGDVYPYLRRHNPFSYFSDVQNTPAQAANIVPLGQLSNDLSLGNLPSLAFIVPNAYGQGHDCNAGITNCTTDQELMQEDDWMKNNLPAILSNSKFQASGTLVVLWDESATDLTNGGGRVAALFLGAHVKSNYQSTSTYQHQDLLKMILTQVGVSSAPGAAGGASTMSEFFQ
jgi:phosphatidylinositol-3-phosphatase